MFLRFGQISFNLARAFAVHHEESFVPAFFKVYIDSITYLITSRLKKKLLFWKKSLEKVLNFGSKNLYER